MPEVGLWGSSLCVHTCVFCPVTLQETVLCPHHMAAVLRAGTHVPGAPPWSWPWSRRIIQEESDVIKRNETLMNMQTEITERPYSALVKGNSFHFTDSDFQEALIWFFPLSPPPPPKEFFFSCQGGVGAGGQMYRELFWLEGARMCQQKKGACQPEKVSCKLSISKTMCSCDTRWLAKHLFGHQSPRGKMKLSCKEDSDRSRKLGIGI